MTHVIAIATMKGGSGKSTLASCLGVHWKLAGRRTTIIDADPQHSIARLALRERALGGVAVVEDASENAWKTAQGFAGDNGTVVIDTPGYRSRATLACIGAADFLLVPVKASPLDVDRMLDTLDSLVGRVDRRPIYRCVLTQTTRDSVVAKHIRSELIEAGYPVLKSEMTNRVIYAEAALWGATPTLIDRNGIAALEIGAIADEIDGIIGVKQAA